MLIAHLSDAHLCAPGHLYQGLVDTAAMLQAALDRLAALDVTPDLLVFTGDLAEDGRPETYALARQMLADLPMPVCLIPGNHDDRAAFRTAFPDGLAPDGPLHRVFPDHGPLRVIGLDLTPPGAHHGDFDADAEAWLTARLAEQPSRPTVILQHQPPFETGITCLDPYRCFGADRLEALIARAPQVEGILCGHIHRFAQCQLGGTLACTAPSTASAIALRLAPGAEPASLLEPPGFLLHRWSGGRLVTHLQPVGTFPGPWPFF